ncbi:MAG: hypothetical protein HXY36_00495 [Chloroflexi bacterium]|nr:hypothetical protein [Chloroflexota bacterium]
MEARYYPLKQRPEPEVVIRVTPAVNYPAGKPVYRIGSKLGTLYISP